MIATDAVSLIFLGCFVFACVVLVVILASGVGHGLHFGGHVVHDLSAAGHAHLAAHPAASATPSASPSHVVHHAGSPSSGSETSEPVTALRDVLLGGLNLYTILMFLLVFGFVGYLLRNFAHASTILSFVVALALALMAGLGLGIALGKLFLAADSSTLTAETSRVEGRIARVSATIRPGGIGEVIYDRPGRSRVSMPARSVDDLPVSPETDVVILSYADGIATVQPWDSFMASVRSGTAHRLEPLEQHF